MSVCRPGPAQNSLLTHSQKKTGPEKQAGRVMKKQMAPARNHYSLARRKKGPQKTNRPSAQALESPEPSISYVLGHQYRFHGNHRAVFFWVGLPAGPRPEIITHSLAEKNRPGKTGRPSNEKQMPLLFFHYSLRTGNRQSNSCSLSGNEMIPHLPDSLTRWNPVIDGYKSCKPGNNS